MEQKYVCGIKAGLVGSVLLGASGLLFMFIYFAIWWTAALSMQNVNTCIMGILVFIFSLCTGALAAHFARGVATRLMDVLQASAVSGAVSGVIFAVIRIVLSFLNPIVVSFLDEYFHRYSYYYGGVGIGPNAGLAAGTCACLCAPATVIVVVILAVIGGAIYGAAVLKLNK